MNSRKGFTLIELIIALTIGTIVIITTYNILFTGTRIQSKTIESYENQADIRYSIETTNNAIRFSSVGFLVTEDDFKPKIKNGKLRGLVKPWNYIGLGPDGKSIMHYQYVPINKDNGEYKTEVLAEALEDMNYNMQFTKDQDGLNKNIIKYILTINENGKKNILSSEVDAINSLHVINWGDVSNPAVALAYRTEETPEINKKPMASIAMVLDTSGSMNWGMDGKDSTINKDNQRRITLLKETLNDKSEGLFSILSETESNVCLVPFATNANTSNEFYNINIESKKDILEGMVTSLSADGGTNVGDGMRRAYYRLKSFNEKPENANREKKNYIVILVDGVTTYASANIFITQDTHGGVWYGEKDTFIENDIKVGNQTYTSNYEISGNRLIKDQKYKLAKNDKLPRVIGDGGKLDVEYGEEYVKLIGKNIQNSNLVDQAFVIGYSNAKDKDGKFHELESVTNIARSLGIAVEDSEASEKFTNNEFVFVASDRKSLNDAFKNIGGYINEDLWQVQGPKLSP